MERTFVKGSEALIAKARATSRYFVGFDGDGVQAPGAVVVRETGTNMHPFVAHYFNSQDGGYYFGDYCKTEDEAFRKADAKVARYDPDGSRRASFDRR